MKRLLCIMYFALPLPGCWEQQEATVARINTQASAEVRLRGRLQRESITMELETFRATKHRALDVAKKAALTDAHAIGKLTPESAIEVDAIFRARHGELDRLVNMAVDVALKQLEWYDNLADVIDATQDYHRTKDRAILAGAAAALESFTQTYMTYRTPAKTEEEKAAREELDKASSELLSLLKARLGVTGGVQ